MSLDRMRPILDSLASMGFFVGISLVEAASLQQELLSHATVLDERIPRLFEFDLEDNAECYGQLMRVKVNLALRVVYNRALGLVRPAELPFSNETGWQEYAETVGASVNYELESRRIDERLYLVRFSERCWGALLTEPMALQILKTGEFDPEAATLHIAGDV